MLNFYNVVSLPTVPFVPYEAVVIERTTSTFDVMLQKLKKKLSLLGKQSDTVRYIDFDMSLAFSNAVCSVFNNRRLPEYMATLMYALKTGNEGVRKRLIRTHIRWCDVHQNRAGENWAKKEFKSLVKKEYREAVNFFRCMRSFLMCATSYRQLCELVGFLDSFLSMNTIPCRLPNECSKTLVLKSEEEVFRSAEAILWKDFGNAPRLSEPEYVYKVFVDACRGRGYNPTYMEDAYDSFMPEDHENRKGPSASTIFESDYTPQKEPDSRETMQILETETKGPQTSDTNQDQGPRDEPFSISGIGDSKHGVLCCLIGPYNVYVVHREAEDGTAMTRTLHRYRV